MYVSYKKRRYVYLPTKFKQKTAVIFRGFFYFVFIH